MANFQMASVLVDTEDHIRATTGLYANQRAYASDQNGAEMFWDATHSVWLWATHMQNIFRWYTDETAPSTTGTDNLLKAYTTLPKLSSMDTLRVSAFFILTPVGSAPTILIKFGPSASLVAGFSLQMNTQDLGYNLLTEMRNDGSVSEQKWFFPDRRIIGGNTSTAAYSTTSKNMGVANNQLGVYVNKVVGSGSYGVVMKWFDISVCGGGVP